MKCLIILPPTDIIDEAVIFPSGIGYVAAALKRAGDVEAVCLNLLYPSVESFEKKLLEVLAEEQPDAVLSGGLFLNIKSIRSIFKTVKEFNPEIITVTGGPVLTSDPEPAMDCLAYADYGIIGEGEVTVVELCRALKIRSDPTLVDGLIIKTPDGYATTIPRKIISDLSSIPWCDIESFGFKEFSDHHQRNHYQATSRFFISLSRGCPFNCTFCYRAHGRKYRQRSLDDFFAELQDKASRFDLRHLELADDLLADSKPRLKEFCRRIKPFNFKVFTVSLRVPQVDREVIEMLQDAGCGAVFLGLENACDHILKSMRKGITIAQIENAMGMLHEARLSARGLFIFGDTEETMETAEETIRWWRAHPEYMIILTPVILYPGSELYRKAISEGLIKDRRQHMEQGLPWVNVSKLSEAEYEELMFNRLPKLNAERYSDPRHQLEALAIRNDFTRFTQNLSGTCRYCGKLVELELNGFFNYSIQFPCPHCGAYYFTPPVAGNRAAVENNLKTAVSRYGHIGFWGVGHIFKQLIDPDSIQDPRIHLIDKKNGAPLHGKAIEPPETIRKHGIKFLITVSPDSKVYHDIRQQARQKYNIKKMIDIYQLQDRELTLP